MGAQSGIGYLIMVARRTLNTDVVMLGMIVLGLQSFILDRCIVYIASLFTDWNERPLETIQQTDSNF